MSHLSADQQLRQFSSPHVPIHCGDGTVPGHKLVLAALGKTLLASPHLFQENVSSDAVLMPDFTRQQILEYFEEFIRCPDLNYHPDINLIPRKTIKDGGPGVIENVWKIETVEDKEPDPELTEEEESHDRSPEECKTETSVVANQEKILLKKIRLGRHMKTEHKEYQIQCKKCNFQAKTKSLKAKNAHELLRRHMNAVHEGITYNCPQCDYISTQKVHLKRHIKSKHEDSRLQCPYCDKSTTRKESLDIHIRSVHEGVKFPCPHCEYQAAQKNGLSVHIKVHEGVKFQCDQCELSYNYESALKIHISAIHLQEKFQCPHCDIKVSRGQNLKRHINRMHSKEISNK